MTRPVYRFAPTSYVPFEMSAPRADGGRVKHWVDVDRTLQVGVFAALVVVALRLWRRHGEVAAVLHPLLLHWFAVSFRRPTAYGGVGLLPSVTMSPVRARQLLTNLIDNCVAHSGREDMAIEVGAQVCADGGARLWVADDGRGGLPEHRERVFGVFERFEDRGAGEGVSVGAMR